MLGTSERVKHMYLALRLNRKLRDSWSHWEYLIHELGHIDMLALALVLSMKSSAKRPER